MENFNYSAIGNRLTGAMPVVPSGNVATVRMRFIFSPDWNGLTKHAVFKKCGKSYDASIENGILYMPSEIMKKPGAFDFGVVGYESDGETVVERISTNMVGGRVIDGAYNPNAENGDAEDHPSDWEKLMEHLSDTSNPHKVKSEQLEDDPILYGTMAVEQGRDDSDQSVPAVEVLGVFGNKTKITPDGIVLDENGGGVQNLRDPYADTDAISKGWADNHYISTDGGTVGGDVIVQGLVSGLRGEFGTAEVSNVDESNDYAVPNMKAVREATPTERETWTFELEGGTTVTKEVALWRS